MLYSFVQKQALALAVSSGLVSASMRQAQSHYSRPKSEDLGLQRSATINLWAENLATTPKSMECDESSPYNTITLAPEVCLSGDYYLNSNFRITEQPLCPDGKLPIMVFYHNRGCTGDVKYHSKFDDIGPPTSCLFDANPKYWSVIFRCGMWATMERGADEHVAAVPPMVDSSSQSDVAVGGAVEAYLGPLCDEFQGGRRERPKTVPVDKCLGRLSYSIRITKPAVCANGTRALWARFKGDKCDYGEITYTDGPGLVDIQDSDIGVCQATGRVGRKNEDWIGSMSFWCDGFGDVKRPDPSAPPEVEKLKPKAGSVSESACQPKAPFFNHPKTDTCVNLRTNKLKIYSSGVCENGTSALWAKYPEKNCVGSPVSIASVSKDMMEKCLDVTDTSSFSFWCTGKGLGTTPPTIPNKPNKPKSGGMPVFLIVILCVMSVVLLGLAVFVAYAFRDQLNVSLVMRSVSETYANVFQGLFRRDGYGSIAL
jgi:hypothetical protein